MRYTKFHVYQVVAEWVVEIDMHGVEPEFGRELALALVEDGRVPLPFMTSAGGGLVTAFVPAKKLAVPSCRLIAVEPELEEERC